MISQEYLKTLFEYRDGELYWKVPKNGRKLNKPVGCILGNTGYKYVCIDYKNYYVHRLVFLYHHGYLPFEVDHKKEKANNIENLRDATKSQNLANKTLQKNNTTGFKNVYKHRNKYVVRVGKKHIGVFDDIELADLVACEARNKKYGEFANHG